MATNDFGTLGWFSVAGAIIMGALYVLDVTNVADSILDPGLTLIVAVLAALGAFLFWVGNDPTAESEGDSTETT
ncbi:hypothetical protein ACFQPA_13475 [Halomarina halobia]|uniref:Uncharacterized protein n=1 Tax=Halomarina halobia TaxID=3033386 RepID=A0ABD6A959_9EURY|nr:hypothetical protein [Halomarina sp. PSR21]